MSSGYHPAFQFTLLAKYGFFGQDQESKNFMSRILGKEGTKPSLELKELQLSLIGKFDHFNGYCPALKWKQNMDVALKFHQFNLVQPFNYPKDKAAQILEANRLKKRKLHERAIETALRNLTAEEMEACWVDLTQYYRRPAFFQDNTKLQANLSPRDRFLSGIPQTYIKFVARVPYTPSGPAISVCLEYCCCKVDRIVLGKGLDASLIEPRAHSIYLGI